MREVDIANGTFIRRCTDLTTGIVKATTLTILFLLLLSKVITPGVERLTAPIAVFCGRAIIRSAARSATVTT